MACTSDKFVINKGMDNEFIITIKQNGSTLPMIIAEAGQVVSTVASSAMPDYITIPAQDAVEYQAEIPYQAPVAEIPYVAAVEGHVERYAAYTMNNYVNVDYKITIDGTDYVVNVAGTDGDPAYASKAELLQALATLIDVRNDVTAYVDANMLYIEGINDTEEFTVYSTDNIVLTQVQEASASVAGQVYVPAQEEVLYQAEVLAQDATPTTYTTTGDALTVDSKVPTGITSYKKVVTITAGNVADVKVDDVSIVPVDGEYDIGTATEFDIIPSVIEGSTTVPDTIYYEVAVVSTTTADNFTAKLMKLDTDVEVLAVSSADTEGSRIEIYDAANGQIKVILSAEDIAALVVSRGKEVDRYYLRPTYRLSMACNTVNNGNFVAKINEVYVEE